MKRQPLNRRTLYVLGMALIAASCGDAGPVDPAADAAQFASLSSVLVECPSSESRSATATIDALGGSVEVAGTRISVPALAVSVPTRITLTLPASNYMEVDIRANDAEHFQFEKAVSITIDYSRCNRANIDKAALSVWYIDSSTKTLLENMGGVDDKIARTITFSSDHLSGFSIAE